jgi:CrcB protein
VWKPLFAIAVGSVVGGWLRWLLGLKLNSLFPDMPPGTLAANLIAGYIIGVAIAVFAHMPQLSPQWRLMVITGFCGGLSTFSTFSAEVVTLLQQSKYALAMGTIAVHVAGSVTMTLAGIATVALFTASAS